MRVQDSCHTSLRTLRVIGMTADSDPQPSVVEVRGDSFELFYERQRRPLIDLAYAVSGSRHGAEDLAQEALAAAFRSWDDISRKDNPGTWVRRILLNKACSAYRRRLAEAKALARHPRDLESVAFPEVTGEIERIWGEVRRLPRRQTQVIALTYLEGLSQAEMAQVLGISKESVNTHLRRARTTLASRLRLEESR